MRMRRLIWPILGLSFGLGCRSVVPPVGMAYSPVSPGPDQPTFEGGVTPPSAPPPAIAALDVAVARAVRRTLREDDRLEPASRRISVSSHNGVVTLSGHVPSIQQREEVLERVVKLPGVDTVNDQLVISR